MEIERIRGPNGKLTNGVSQRRLVYIKKLKESHESRVKIGMFMASLYGFK